MDTMYKLAKFTYYTTVFIDEDTYVHVHMCMTSDLQMSLLQAIAVQRV